MSTQHSVDEPRTLTRRAVVTLAVGATIAARFGRATRAQGATPTTQLATMHINVTGPRDDDGPDRFPDVALPVARPVLAAVLSVVAPGQRTMPPAGAVPALGPARAPPSE
jgi:hypothetical protein